MGVDRQKVGRGIKLPGGPETPGVEGLPRGDETSRVTPDGDGVPGEDGRGQGGDGNPSTTR